MMNASHAAFGARSRRIALAIVVLLAAAARPELASTIAIGPYVQNVGTDNATICWSTLAGKVSYSRAGVDKPTSSRTFDYRKVTLRGLKPGTTYKYDVLGDGSDEGKGAFATFAQGEHPFSFATLPDCHNQTGEGIVKRILADKPDMVFAPGDMTYEGRDLSHWEEFFRINRELMRTVPYYPAPGNHEHVDATSPYFDFFSLPGNQRYYSFDRGTTHFVVFDSAGLYERESNQSSSPVAHKRFKAEQEEYWRTQLAWFKDDLAANQGAKYIFVFFHHPVYTSYSHRIDSTAQMRARFGTMFRDYRVSAVFNGHDHQYHHAFVGGVHFVMTCAGGAPLGTDARQPETIKDWKPHNYARVDVGLARAHLRAVDINGKLIEEFDIMPRAAHGGRQEVPAARQIPPRGHVGTDAAVGYRFLQEFVVTFDSPHKRVWTSLTTGHS
jgi:hypothetical protein